MNQEFKYGEWVEVRDGDAQEWKRRVYFGTVPTPSGECHYTMSEYETEQTFDGSPIHWRQIRKIQPATLEERVAALEEQIRKMQQP